MLDVLVTAVLRLSHAALGPMAARGRGGVINVSSVAAFLPRGTYSAAKAWVNSFSEWAHNEYQPRGVTVMALCPGFTKTEFHERMEVKRGDNFMWLDVEFLVAHRAGRLRQGSRLLGARCAVQDRRRADASRAEPGAAAVPVDGSQVALRRARRASGAHWRLRPARPARAAVRTPRAPWCCSPGRGRSCRCRGGRSSRWPPGRGCARSTAAASRASGAWSWWSTSMPLRPRSRSSASRSSVSTPDLPRPHGCAITPTPPASRTSPITSSSGHGVAVDVGRATGVQEAGEGLVAVDHEAGGHQHVGHVRTAGGCGVDRAAAYGLLGDVEAERTGAWRRSPAPGSCARPGSCRERSRAAGASGRAGRRAGGRWPTRGPVLISMPRTSVMPASPAAAAGLGPALGRVVVGERDDVETGARRPGATSGAGIVRAVADRRVGVEVDAHPRRLSGPWREGAFPDAHHTGGGPPKASSTNGAPRPEASRRIHSSRSSSIAEAGRSTSHSQRPAASPTITDRSNSSSASLVDTAHSEHRHEIDAHLHHGRPLADVARIGAVESRDPRTETRARLLRHDQHVHGTVEGAGARHAAQRRARSRSGLRPPPRSR